MPGYGFYIDSYYLLLIVPALIICTIAQIRVSTTFSRYSSLPSRRGLTGAEVARQMLDRNGLRDVAVEAIRGNLTDHYDPAKRVVCLSDTVYGSTSVAAIGVAAHETGHAIQHAQAYLPLKFRTAIFPVVRFSSAIALPLAILGLIVGWAPLTDFGILLFSLIVLFQLVTLPVEFNASTRAITALDDMGILSAEELSPAKKVLHAAALTYVASALMAIANLLRLLLLRNRR